MGVPKSTQTGARGGGGHMPRKRFGQHFLTDAATIDAIILAIAPRPDQTVVEIGPGLGALTQPLVERLGHLVVIELDRDLARRLRARDDLTVIESDVLTVDFSALIRKFDPVSHTVLHDRPPRLLRVVGNLPYNISTPILFHLLGHAPVVADQHFMLQKEVVQRMVASPATSAYGRLSVMLQWRYTMENILHVRPESFSPPPRVDSAVVRMVPRLEAPSIDVDRLSQLVQVAFSQRRKLLRHTLGRWLADNDYTGDFDLQRRAEEVPVGEYIALVQPT